LALQVSSRFLPLVRRCDSFITRIFVTRSLALLPSFRSSFLFIQSVVYWFSTLSFCVSPRARTNHIRHSAAGDWATGSRHGRIGRHHPQHRADRADRVRERAIVIEILLCCESAAMAPETSTQTVTHTEPQTTTTMHPVQDNSLPTPPPRAQQTFLTEQRSSSNPVQPAQPFVLYPGSYGEPFIPYNENQQQPQQFATLPRPVVPERKAWRITKDVLHVLAIVTSIMGLGFGFSLLSYGFDSAIGTIAACPLFVVALIWSVAEEITRWVRNWGAGIHPGAHVGMSLFLWLASGVVGGLLAALASLNYLNQSDNNSSYNDPSNYEPLNGGSWPRFLAVVVLMLVLWLVHFIIFVGACIDTAKRNAAKSKPIMVVAQPPYWGPTPQQGWQQPMTQPVYPSQHTHYQQPQFQGMPVHPQATSPRAVSGDGQGSGNGKQPEMVKQSTPADHGVREFYTPAGSSSAT
ncbi:hypothetical protein TOPH_05252, partial [Tolypocladium ophioglossoides CBS 100239]